MGSSTEAVGIALFFDTGFDHGIVGICLVVDTARTSGFRDAKRCAGGGTCGCRGVKLFGLPVDTARNSPLGDARRCAGGGRFGCRGRMIRLGAGMLEP